MKTRVTAAFTAATMCITTPSFAESVNHDASQFDVAGLKLGMSAKEAMAKVSEDFGVAPEDIRTSMTTENPVTGKDEITYFIAQTDSFELHVSVTAAVPPNEEIPLVISSITYSMKGTPQNQAMVRERALEKYGAPTRGKEDEPVHFPLAWCTIPAEQPNASCEAVPGPRLSLRNGMSGIELTLSDQGYQNAVRDYVNGVQSSKPEF